MSFYQRIDDMPAHYLRNVLGDIVRAIAERIPCEPLDKYDQIADSLEIFEDILDILDHCNLNPRKEGP